MAKKSILGNYSELQYGKTYMPEKKTPQSKALEKAKGGKRPYNMENRKKFGEYLKKNPPGTMKGDKKAMFEHNRQEWDK